MRAAQWPEIFAALVERAARRAERLVVMQAIAHLTRVDDRLLALLWCLAERWGRVVPGGVLVSLRLPHRTLAGMVGARRPSVTTALGQLIARGEIERRADGGWILRGTPPEPRTAPRERHALDRISVALARPAADDRLGGIRRAAGRSASVRPARSDRGHGGLRSTGSVGSVPWRRAGSRSSERPTVSAPATPAAVEVEDRELAVVERAAHDLAGPSARPGRRTRACAQSARSDQKYGTSSKGRSAPSMPRATCCALARAATSQCSMRSAPAVERPSRTRTRRPRPRRPAPRSRSARRAAHAAASPPARARRCGRACTSGTAPVPITTMSASSAPAGLA